MATNLTNTQATSDQVAAFRDFNRFHTKLVGALSERLLSSDYSLPQVRVLYEIAHAPAGEPLTATGLGRELALDAGYLSRLLAGLESSGLVARSATPGNGKRLALALTTAGKQLVVALEAASADQVAGLLQSLTVDEQSQLLGAMACMQRLLGKTNPRRTFILRDPQPGDLGTIISQQARLYAQEYGWDQTFEGLLAEIVACFVKEFQPGKERCWVAECEGHVVGSVFVMRVDDETAKLRMLYVDEKARGLGLGRSLVDECMRFARNNGYSRMVLWTNDILVSARRIYEAAGFVLESQEAHHSFGKDLVGQIWGRAL